MSNIKLCKDCRHYKKGFFGFGHCWHPENFATDLENGKVRIRTDYANSTRYSDYYCGTEGKWFEPKNL